MANAEQLHADQHAYWNGPVGEAWAAQQAHTDIQLSPVTQALLAAARIAPGERVLDIGCGCGATTLLAAETAAHVTGLDISVPMLSWARQRGAGRDNIAWLLADAAAHPFEDGSFDLLMSRFGVMFFGDPVAAFANLRRAARAGGRMVFACWRPFEENDWMREPLKAVYAAGVPRQPRPAPEEPGPFAFADPDRVRRILTAAGWPMPTLTPVDVMIDLSAGAGLAQAVEQASNIGPASRALRAAPEELRAPAIAAIRDVLSEYETSDGVRLGGAVWVVSAEAT